MFWRKRKKADPALHALQKQLYELQKDIYELKNEKKEYHFQIEKVDIHQAALDKLLFQLDKIDIEDLSGALNVGNNFGVTIEDEKGSKKKNGEKETSNSFNKNKVTRTKDGYSISFLNKEDD
ncbi:hypothetical protein [Gracilibacillus sp. YIM 98692]|uniref:hypothetical protein n=1 Tax=Gracilibacillus sp. YIM 98692 TaxID=2663532 RepID=UPI0013D6210E|nr:hypothetical protein [Gracilibacillus sp. YIM 98692]